MRSSTALLLVALAACHARAQETEPVRAIDHGREVAPATWECTAGHPVAKHKISLQAGALTYTFLASGCQDPSHGEEHPCNEGTFGMPSPTSANWYWGGFLRVLVNGSEATTRAQRDMRVLEDGPRGSFQTVWSHPDAEVGLRLVLRPGSNHVDGLLVWRPREGATVDSVALRLTCYPSFFTAAQHRKGERHCATPRTDQAETSTLELVPAEDPWLYYYDAVFDTARGEGSGPCAALFDPVGVAAGRVRIGDYAVVTEVDLTPAAGSARLAFYDFTGHTNAEAEAYLRDRGQSDLDDLRALDFRPAAARAFDEAKLRTEALDLVAKAAADGEALRPQVLELLARVSTLRTAAEGGDWVAEADLCSALADSQDLFWKLRTFAALNSPETIEAP